MQQINSLDYYNWQQTTESTYVDDTILLEDLILESKTEFLADIEMDDKSVRKSQFDSPLPMKKGSFMNRCNLVDEFLSPESTDQNLAT